ncbi:inositol monophosphatase [Ammoniphilus sp. YIM 78166]|uniref:inositol monophosphatase family protein n=1 Tax=Ammoniphilus sp. YIM 78166 TaxID=1644106 RepID=UPI00106F58D7|nr:inositol monophosphatase [Ammoniphilus sp. YIM 78166]
MCDFNQMFEQAKAWAIEAGKLSLARLESPIQFTYKSSPSDLVTHVDKEVEEFLVNMILKHYPDHGIVGEEGTFERDPKDFETLWIIDPIDGTTNFIHQKLNYVISIAVVHQEVGMIGIIYDPSRDELFCGRKGEGAYLNGQRLRLELPVKQQEALICTSLFWNQRAEKYGLEKVVYDLPRTCRGIRVYGCAALEMAYVAAGRVDAYVSLHLNPWDFAGGKVILEEAGGSVSNLEGEELSFSGASTVVASNPFLYPELMAYMKQSFN